MIQREAQKRPDVFKRHPAGCRNTVKVPVPQADPLKPVGSAAALAQHV
ncbi:hypothetical protein [Paenibacillus agricola]|nr:hypothetical protein [Paenibacillus agricola]